MIFQCPTTWVFRGLLCGRELAMATMTGKEKSQTVFSGNPKTLLQNDDRTRCIRRRSVNDTLCDCTQTDFKMER